MIESILSRINALLVYDAGSTEALRMLDGALVGIIMTSAPDKPIVIRLGYPLQSVANIDEPAATPALWITGTPLQLLALLKGSRKDAVIDGSIELLETLEAVWTNLDIQWSQLLASSVGVETASVLSTTASGVVRWARSTSERFRHDVLAYLQDERSAIPHPREFEQFADEVLELRQQIDDLESRLNSVAISLTEKVTDV